MQQPPAPSPPPAAVAPALDSAARDATARDSAARDTAGYPTAALRALVAAAAHGNRLPADLASYRAAVESEIAVAARREDGLEGVVSVEQVATTLRWTRAGYYDQHVVGDRARQAGLTFSVLALARTGWAAPVLYGNRLRLRRDARDAGAQGGARPAVRRGRTAAADTAPVVHPLADDRDRYYRYAGGDTVVTIGAGDRRVPIVRVLVEPRPGVPAGTGLFRGELDLDATHHAVVRLRGRYLVAAAPAPSLGARVRRAVTRTVLPRAYAYVEFVNAERADARGGRYWLPAYQRVEAQVGSPALGGAGVVARLVSRFREVAVNDTALPAADLAANADSVLRRERRRLTRAPADSLGRYAGWRSALGDLTGAAHADDFADLGPAALAPAGPPRGEFFVPRAADLVHFNRVDGLYVGAGVRTRFRDLAPGLTLTATAGWAEAARAPRGRVELARRLGAPNVGTPNAGAGWTLALRAGRALDLTNDFRSPLDSGSSLGALLGADEYDYVDRRSAGLALARAAAAAGGPAGARALVVRLEAGAAEDRGDSAHVRRSPVGGLAYRPNRGVDAGRYLRTALAVEWRPDVAAEYVRPGVGARLYAERGDALGARGLRYTRVEGRLAARRELLDGGGAGPPGRNPLGRGTLTLAARADAGLVAGGGAAGPPPQQLFELGSAQGLFGYGYKAFAGDRAAAARGLLLYTGPYLRAPFRVWRFALPGPAPGLAAGAQLGRAEASGAAARASVARLGLRADTLGVGGLPVPASRPSDGWRAGVTAGATLFGGGVFVGAARPVDGHADRPRGWRGIVAFGQVF